MNHGNDGNLFRLTVEMNNSAFHENEYGPNEQLSMILSELAVTVLHGGSEGKLKDINGNTVGSWEID